MPNTTLREEIVEMVHRLNDTPNWMKEEFGKDWKDTTTHYNRTPFEAANLLKRIFNFLSKLKEQGLIK
jgi:hypothetical protein